MNQSEKITFIIPNRGGKYINFIISQLKKYYQNSSYLVISQDDDLPFMRGQLWNIAYNYAHTEYMCFIDNDIFFENNVDLIDEYIKANVILMQPLHIVKQVTIINNDTYIETSKNQAIQDARGGCSFISKKNFEKINGMSNLYIGWGNEDNAFYDRTNNSFKRLLVTVCHITHPSRFSEQNIDTIHNRETYANRNNINTLLDGYKDTTYICTYDKIQNGIHYIGVNHIYVNDNFLYKNYIHKHYSSNYLKILIEKPI